MKRVALLIGAMLVVPLAYPQNPVGTGLYPPNKNFEDEPAWKEQQEVTPPAYPKDENLKEFYVSATETNTFMIDSTSLSVGTDNVVRYVLVIKMTGGAKNVSYEGINCRERMWKLYATGRIDGTWAPVRNAAEWRRIENKMVNRHHMALSKDLFCPLGTNIRTADEGRNALRLGKHPDVN